MSSQLCPPPSLQRASTPVMLSSSLSRRRITLGSCVPQIDLVLQKPSMYWRVFGANSMVEVSNGVLCLGFADGGSKPRTSIVIGGHHSRFC
ncbi:Basic 7S globulin [Morella rubra]|uniref:Basic 7S globulin n=1 Tax=Morella rubra TaxID=262757 RepID=A0A6A1VLQ1_9ROSI|nr:Basic 7S globulin [Morella rubra]